MQGGLTETVQETASVNPRDPSHSSYHSHHTQSPTSHQRLPLKYIHDTQNTVMESLWLPVTHLVVPVSVNVQLLELPGEPLDLSDPVWRRSPFQSVHTLRVQTQKDPGFFGSEDRR